MVVLLIDAFEMLSICKLEYLIVLLKIIENDYICC